MARILRTFCFSLVALTCVAVFSSTAAAQFETRTRHSLPTYGDGFVAGDFNGDGKLDIAVCGDDLMILLGNGDGTFQNPIRYPIAAFFVAAADFNQDGKLDLVVADLAAASVSVLLGKGDGTFGNPIVSPTTGWNSFLAVGDFNNDGRLDIVVISPPYISVLLSNGDGTFQPPSDNDSFVGPQQLTVGDFNNDHRLDVLVDGFSGGSSNFGVLLGNGDGTLQPSLTHPLPITPDSPAAVGDFNHDGNLDFAIAEDGELARHRP